MEDMPGSVQKYYKLFINSRPDSWHPTALDLFYIFCRNLFGYSRKERSQGWLERNLKEDCEKISDEDIKKYGDIYRHLKEYRNVGRSQTAKLLAKDSFEKMKERAREKYSFKNKN